MKHKQIPSTQTTREHDSNTEKNSLFFYFTLQKPRYSHSKTEEQRNKIQMKKENSQKINWFSVFFHSGIFDAGFCCFRIKISSELYLRDLITTCRREWFCSLTSSFQMKKKFGRTFVWAESISVCMCKCFAMVDVELLLGIRKNISFFVSHTFNTAWMCTAAAWHIHFAVVSGTLICSPTVALVSRVRVHIPVDFCRQQLNEWNEQHFLGIYLLTINLFDNFFWIL